MSKLAWEVALHSNKIQVKLIRAMYFRGTISLIQMGLRGYGRESWETWINSKVVHVIKWGLVCP